jgi:hypothetical protein
MGKCCGCCGCCRRCECCWLHSTRPTSYFVGDTIWVQAPMQTTCRQATHTPRSGANPIREGGTVRAFPPGGATFRSRPKSKPPSTPPLGASTSNLAQSSPPIYRDLGNMSKTINIQSKQQFADVLQKSRLVVVDCECPPVPQTFCYLPPPFFHSPRATYGRVFRTRTATKIRPSYRTSYPPWHGWLLRSLAPCHHKPSPDPPTACPT